MTDSYITPLYIESSAEGQEYFGLYAGGIGYYVIIRRTSTATRRLLAYKTFTDRQEFLAAGASPQTLQALKYEDAVISGINLNFLFAGSAIRASNTAAAPSTTDGTVDQGGDESNGGMPSDSEAQMMQVARLTAIQGMLSQEGGLPVVVEFPRQQHVLVDNLDDDSAVAVRMVGEPVLTPGAASETGQALIAARVNQLLDQLATGFADQQRDALTNAQLRAAPVPVSVSFPTSQPITANSLPLPAGAATEAKQDTANTALSAISNKLPGLTNGKLPVEVQFPSTQAVTVTFPASQAVTGAFYPSVQPVSGPATDTQLRATPLPVAVTFPASQAVVGPLTDTQLRAAPLSVVGTFYQATQPISAAALPLPTGASTAALQTAGNTSLATLAANSPTLVGGAVPVTGTLTASTAPKTSGGLTGKVVVTSGASINATVVKASAGQVYTVHASNTATSARFLSFFNKATAPTSADAAVEVYVIPAGSFIRVSFDGLGSQYSTGIAFTVTSNNGLLGGLVGLLVAGEVVINTHFA